MNRRTSRRLATSRPQEFLSERGELFRPRSGQVSDEVPRGRLMSRLRGFHLRFAPNMGSSVTPIWGFRLHLRVPDFKGGMYWFDPFWQKQSNACVFLRHRKSKFIYFVLKVVSNKDFNSMKRQARASDRDSSEQKNHSNKSALFVARNVLPSTDSSITRCHAEMQQHNWVSVIFMRKRVH